MNDTLPRGGQPTAPGFFVKGAATLVLCTLLAGCESGGRSIPLTPVYESKDAIAEAFLRALAARDQAALETLVVSEVEFRKYIWPKLPASAPDVGMPLDYVWSDTRLKNAGHLARLLSDHGGSTYKLVAVTFAGETTDYGPYRVHRETTLDVRGPKGAEALRLFGSLVESGGRWKIYSFVVD